MRNFELTHVRHDRAHCLVPGLFRSLKRGERKREKLDVTYKFGEKETVRFVGFEPLGADDMRVLQGLVAKAGPDGRLLNPEPKTEKGKELRLLMEPKFDGAHQSGLVVRDSLYGLLTEIGLTDGGDNIRALKASLLRMSNVTVVVEKDTKQASFHLMSYAFDEANGQLLVALNPRLANAVLGKQPHVQIDMSEVRSINSDIVRLIHQRLCGWIDPGKSGRATLDTICGYVWPDKSNPATMRKHRERVRKSFDELQRLNWTVTEYAKGKLEIQRPKPQYKPA